MVNYSEEKKGRGLREKWLKDKDRNFAIKYARYIFLSSSALSTISHGHLYLNNALDGKI